MMVDLWIVAFVLLLVLLVVAPIIQQRRIEAQRLQKIGAIEAKRNSRVITLIHRQEIMSLLGIPILRYIDINDSEDVLRAVRMTPDSMPIDIIVHTPGGLVLSAEQIAMALKRHAARVTIFVPHYAMSGGTLLCLTADEVVMDENAVLGPVDPQLGEYPAVSILSVLEAKESKDIDDKTLILADIARKAQAQVHEFVTRMLEGKVDDAQAEKIATTLTEGRWTHDYPITFEQAKAMGLPVSMGMPVEIYQLMDLFPQAIQRRPSVAYIPVPYRKEANKKKEK
jgi:ClpP class serine protease